MIRNALRAAFLLILSTGLATAASTINPSVPAQNSSLSSAPIRQNFQAAYNDINKILNCYSGSSAPVSPTTFQFWCDTTGAPTGVLVKQYDGSSWLTTGTINQTAHTYTPVVSSGNFVATAPLTVSVVGSVATFGLNIDSNFAVVSQNLALASIAAGNLLANDTGGSAEPTSTTPSAWFSQWCSASTDRVPYSTGASTWGCLQLLGAAHSWTAAQTFSATMLKVGGAGAGVLSFSYANTAANNTVTWPAGTTDFSATGGTAQVLFQTSAGGAITVARPTCSTLSDAVALCSSTDAANLSGTVASARLTGSYTGITGVGTLTAGATGAGFTVALGTSTITGTLPSANVSGSYTGITGTGTLTAGATGAGFTVALSTSTITGTLAAARLPAFGGGDVSCLTAGGNCTIAASAVTTAQMANAAAYTIFGNFTGSAAAPQYTTIGALTQKASPGAADLIPIQDQAAGGQIKYATVSSIASAGSVASVNGLAGSVTLQGIVNIGYRFGSFDIWQRGAGGSASIAVAASSTSGVYTVDGCYLLTNANQASTVSQQTGIAVGSVSSAKVLRNNGQTGTGVMRFGCPMGTDELTLLQGNFITVSFTIKEGANQSFSHSIPWAFYCGTGSPSKRGSAGYTSETTVVSGTVTTTTTAARVTGTSSAVYPTNCTQAEFQVNITPSGTAGADDSFTVDDLQIEVVAANTATASSFRYVDFTTQLRAAQRYYQKTFPYATAPADNAGAAGSLVGGGFVTAVTSEPATRWQFLSEMYATPTITRYNTLGGTAGQWTDGTVTSANARAINTGTSGVQFDNTGVALSNAAGASYRIQAAADAGL